MRVEFVSNFKPSEMTNLSFISDRLFRILKDYPDSKKLILDERSAMGSVISLNKLSSDFFIPSPKTSEILVELVLDNKKPIAWSWNFNKKRQPVFWLYVLPEYRRRGIGYELFQRSFLNSKNKYLKVEPWDYRSRKFFSMAKERVQDELDIRRDAVALAVQP